VREFPLEMTRTRAFCFWTNSRFLTGQGVVLLSPLSGWFSKNEHKELKKKVLLRLRHYWPRVSLKLDFVATCLVVTS
jgi:hypothetical protein